ncbi:YjcZ family sporulation protein [Lysinibacillus sp. NPDC097287]|uniref:YjcZ family sporulation protein n=1 Tax=Lysinibacillus sp. NPDC097287 TaxID=3364144 RepID=UPI0037F36685
MGYYGYSGNFNNCCTSYGNEYRNDCGKNNSSTFVLIVVLFILLIIVGASFMSY